MQSLFRILPFALGLVLGATVARAGNPPSDPAALLEARGKNQAERLAWWDEARFGLMVSYGVPSVPAGVWRNQRIPGEPADLMAAAGILRDEYRAYAQMLTAAEYDPGEWVGLAAQAGVRYAVLTAKASDGFALFDSPATNWDAVDAAACHRDLLRPFLAACRRNGLRTGLACSHAIDWMHPGGAMPAGIARWDPTQSGDFESYLKTIARPQVKSLLQDYGSIDLWSWGRGTTIDRAQAESFLALLAAQPAIVTDQWIGGGLPGDIEVVESDRLPPGRPGVRQEWRIPMNGFWGYSNWQHEWKPGGQLVCHLVEAASQGANLVLGVGLDARGSLPREAVVRLKDIGRWMSVNAESIHGTSASPLAPVPWGRCTVRSGPKSTTFYLHVLTWPSDRRLVLTGLEAEVIDARLLADPGARLKVTPLPRGLSLRVPAFPVDDAVTTIALRVKPGWKTTAPYCAATGDGHILLPAEAAELSGAGPVLAGSDLPVLAWWDNASVSVSWSFLVEEPGDYRVVARYASPQGSKFSIKKEGSEPLYMDSPGTGDWGRIVPFEVGTFRFDKPGFHRLRLIPAPDGWNPLNLRSVELEPVAAKGKKDG